ncbi:MAG: elongation factor P hydroxylase [Pseudomonadales bacterium]|nr:elongation factor P hydroxylase [Pseudomonadales bacterium]
MRYFLEEYNIMVFYSDEILNIQSIADVFKELFEGSENTILQWGAAEPIYLPSDASCSYNRVVARDDYFSSGLHELAHWCIAGAKRRRLVDYGYWYYPDGRDEEQQRLFEQVEIKPQAVEWILSQACGLRFNVSADNLHGETGDVCHFKDKVFEQVDTYLSNALPERAELLTRALAKHYGRERYLYPQFFLREAI